MPKPLAMDELAVEIQADLAEVERDAAASEDAAAKTRGPRHEALVRQCGQLLVLVKAAHRRAFRAAGMVSGVERDAG